MKVMTGLIKPDRGDVKIFGHSIISDYEKAMSCVGCLIETAQSYPLSAYDNLKLHARYYPHVDSARIEEVLALTGMLKYKNEKTAPIFSGDETTAWLSRCNPLPPENTYLGRTIKRA
jgi:ABC-2 type transport system ATP-binding protein